MNGNYLIPANSKRSMLILSLFTPVDLIILAIGGGFTLLLLMFIPAETMQDVFIILIPLLMACIMILPVPNHRNVWQLTVNIFNFLTHQRSYRWKGWCVIYGEEESK